MCRHQTTFQNWKKKSVLGVCVSLFETLIYEQAFANRNNCHIKEASFTPEALTHNNKRSIVKNHYWYQQYGNMEPSAAKTRRLQNILLYLSLYVFLIKNENDKLSNYHFFQHDSSHGLFQNYSVDVWCFWHNCILICNGGGGV